jgi:hypothetical protein
VHIDTGPAVLILTGEHLQAQDRGDGAPSTEVGHDTED